MSRDRALGAGLTLATLAAVATLALATPTRSGFWPALAGGERILAAGVAHAEPDSYTAPASAADPAWAAQALLALLWHRGGRTALLALKAAVLTGTFGLVLLTARARGVGALAGAATVLLAAWAGSEFWQVRPALFTYLGLAALLWLLRPGWERRPRSLALVPALAALWANLDPGFLAAGPVIAVTVAGSALPRLADPARRREGARVLALGAAVAAGAGLAALATPFGPRTLATAWLAGRDVPLMAATAEWFGPNFHHPGFRGFELLLLLLFPAFARGRRRLTAVDVGLTLVFAHLALASMRHIPLFAIAAAPALAGALETALAAPAAVRGGRLREAIRRGLPSIGGALASSRAPVAGAVLAIGLGVAVYWAATVRVGLTPWQVDLDEGRYPARTVAFIRAERLPAPLFSVAAWGGYELWRLSPDYRMFVGAQPFAHPRAVLGDFVEVVHGGARWAAVLDRWDVQTLLAVPGSTLAELARLSGRWRLVFTARDAAVFVRDSEANRSVLARLGLEAREAGPAQAAGPAPDGAVRMVTVASGPAPSRPPVPR
jgi:hypothetical protein